MALDLLNQVSHFKICHIPYETLKLRIEIHTGPCAAGQEKIVYNLYFTKIHFIYRIIIQHMRYHI